MRSAIGGWLCGTLWLMVQFGFAQAAPQAIELPDPSLEIWGKAGQRWGAEWSLSKTGRCWTEGAHQGRYCALIHSQAGRERCVLRLAPRGEIQPGMRLRVSFFARWLQGDNMVWVTFQERAPYPLDWYPLWHGAIPKDGRWHRLEAELRVPQFPAHETTLALCLGIPQSTESPWIKDRPAPPDTEYLLDDLSLTIVAPGHVAEPKRPVKSVGVADDPRDNRSPYGVYWTPWRTYCGTPLTAAHEFDKTHEEICRDLDLMQRIGVRWIRSVWRWDKIEWQQGQFDYALLDFVVAEAWRRQIRIVPALATPPRWASTAPRDEPSFHIYPPQLPAWETFVEQTVRHFHTRIKYWEVWNEPNIMHRWSGTAEDYFRLVRATSTTARRADPTAQILIGALAQSGFAFLDQLLAMGAKDYFQVVSCHPYPHKDGQPRIEALVERLRLVLADYGCEDRSIWFTEVGWKAADVGGSAERIRRLRAFYAQPFDGAVEKRFWFMFDSWDRRPVAEGHSLVRVFEGKVELGPAYTAYGQMTGARP